MVIRYIATLIFLPIALFAAEFSAQVSQTQTHVGQPFVLNLILKDATPSGSPAIGELKKSFTVNSHQQQKRMFLMNGVASQVFSWRIELLPLKEGDTYIPSITIDTFEGQLASDPIAIKVLSGPSSHEAESLTSGITVSEEVSHKTPYKNEPFIYTVTLATKRAVANVGLQHFVVENAIVEPNGEPQVTKKVIDNQIYDVVDFSYLITPLKAGTLKLPGAILQGGIPVKRRSPFSSLHDDDFDPFAMLQGFEQLKPFTLSTEGLSIEVLPPAVDMSPWLPAKSLTIQEIWNDNQVFKVGEPFTRSFVIQAEGVKANQLTGIEALQVKLNSLNVYADKPEVKDEITNGLLKSVKKEQYTLIPKEPGTIELPEISIEWWDVSKKAKVLTRVSSRKVNILPSALGSTKEKQEPIAEAESEFRAPAEKNDNNYSVFEILSMVLALLLGGTLLWVGILKIKMGRLAKKPVMVQPYSPFIETEKETAKAVKRKKETLKDLNPT